MYRLHKQTNRGEAGSELILVASIVLILGVVWAISGGPERSGSGDLGVITSGQSIISGVDNFFIPITREPSGTASEVDQKYDDIFEEFGDIKDFGEVSPYWGLITISESSSGPKQTSVQKEYVTLNVSSKLTDEVEVTGWKLQSMITNKTISIPEATKVSIAGNVNIEQPIKVSPKDKVYISTGHSPVGTSFQINKCSGYFEQFQDFTPSISKQCPLPEDEFIFSENDPFRFSEACVTHIENIERCHMPLDALPIGLSDSCALFVTEEINYSSCVENHKNDDDFLKHEWRVYLKGDQEAWNTRDIIRLLDRDGKTVDVFNY